MAPVVTSTSIIFSSNKIQNADILVPTNPGPPGKMAIKLESLSFLSNKLNYFSLSKESMQMTVID